MLITLATLKLAVSVLSIVCIALVAVTAFTAYSVDRLNRDLSRLVGDVSVLRSGLKDETKDRESANASISWLVTRCFGHLDDVNARADSINEALSSRVDSVDEYLTGRVNSIDEYLAGSERTCGNLGADFDQVAENLAEVSASLFGAANAVHKAARRYQGVTPDDLTYDQAEAGGDVSRGTLVELYGEDVCSLDAVDDDDDDDQIPY